MATHSTAGSLVAALSRAEGKAEIVGGEIRLMSPAGGLHNRAAGSLYLSLRRYERTRGFGFAYADNAGFLVDLPHRNSFSPDAAFHLGPPPGPGFVQGAPLLAVEVRSPDDYGPAAEPALAAKRADYFSAGTRVVLDVDVLREGRVAVYRAAAPETPVTFGRGDVLTVEPEMPGWAFAVNELFD